MQFLKVKSMHEYCYPSTVMDMEGGSMRQAHDQGNRPLLYRDDQVATLGSCISKWWLCVLFEHISKWWLCVFLDCISKWWLCVLFEHISKWLLCVFLDCISKWWLCALLEHISK